MPNLLCALRRMDKPITVAEMISERYEMALVAGHLGRDPETRYTQTGKSVCKVSLAVSWGKRGEPDQVTEWIELVAWEDQAYLLADLRKGAAVYAWGRIGVNTWTGRDGAERTTGQLTVWGLASPMMAQRGDIYDQRTDSGSEEIPF